MLNRISLLALMPLAMVSGLLGGRAISEENANSTPSEVAFAATTWTSPVASGAAETYRSADGLFHVPVLIDGHEISMIVDTGASLTIISRSNLDNMGKIDWVESPPGKLKTLNGVTLFQRAKFDEFRIGNHVIHDVEIGVINDIQPISVIGHDILRRLDSITIEGDTIRLR